MPAELHSNILAPFKYVLTVDLNFLGIITAGLFALVLLAVSFLTRARKARRCDDRLNLPNPQRERRTAISER